MLLLSLLQNLWMHICKVLTNRIVKGLLSLLLLLFWIILELSLSTLGHGQCFTCADLDRVLLIKLLHIALCILCILISLIIHYSLSNARNRLLKIHRWLLNLWKWSYLLNCWFCLLHLWDDNLLWSCDHLGSLLGLWSLARMILHDLIKKFLGNWGQGNGCGHWWCHILCDDVDEVHLAEHNLRQLLSINVSLLNLINKHIGLLKCFFFCDCFEIYLVLGDQIGFIVGFILQFLCLFSDLDLFILCLFFLKFLLDLLKDSLLIDNRAKTNELIEVWLLPIWNKGRSNGMMVVVPLMVAVLMVRCGCRGREEQGEDQRSHGLW